MGEHPRRGGDPVPVRVEPRQERGQFARDALDAADLAADRRAAVDHDGRAHGDRLAARSAASWRRSRVVSRRARAFSAIRSANVTAWTRSSRPRATLRPAAR